MAKVITNSNSNSNSNSHKRFGIFSLQDQFTFYGSYHTNHVNILIHIICVPTIFFTALILSHNLTSTSFLSLSLPFLSSPLDLTIPFLISSLYSLYFIALEPVAGILYAPILLTLGHLSNTLYYQYPTESIKYAGWAFGASWIAQFIGHGKFEGRAPALFDSLLQSLVLAVFFVFLEVLFALGYRPDLNKKLQNRIGVAVTEYRRSLRKNMSLSTTLSTSISSHHTSTRSLPLTTSLDRESCEIQGENLRGKGVVVTGAGNGFGKAYAVKAAGFGAKLVLSDINVASVQEVCSWITSSGGTAFAYPHPCDTSSWESQIKMFQFAVEKLGEIDVVVPNAGVGETGDWMEDKLDKEGSLLKPNFQTINVNLIGAAYTIRIGFYYLRRNATKKKKAIVMIGSMASFSGIPKAPAYSLAKHGVLGLFRSIYYNGEVEGININMIAPWFCDTAIIAPMTRIGIFGLPLAQVPDVVGAMIKASSDEDCSGNVLSVDADGVLVIPYEAYGAGEGGYYEEFAKRASRSIGVEHKIKDLGLIISQTFAYWTRTKKGRLAVLGALFVLIRARWQRSRHP